MKFLRLEEFVCIVFGGLFVFGFLLYTTISLYLGGMRIQRLTPVEAGVLRGRTEHKNVSGHSAGYVPEILIQYEIKESKF